MPGFPLPRGVTERFPLLPWLGFLDALALRDEERTGFLSLFFSSVDKSEWLNLHLSPGLHVPGW